MLVLQSYSIPGHCKDFLGRTALTLPGGQLPPEKFLGCEEKTGDIPMAALSRRQFQQQLADFVRQNDESHEKPKWTLHQTDVGVMAKQSTMVNSGQEMLNRQLHLLFDPTTSQLQLWFNFYRRDGRALSIGDINAIHVTKVEIREENHPILHLPFYKIGSNEQLSVDNDSNYIARWLEVNGAFLDALKEREKESEDLDRSTTSCSSTDDAGEFGGNCAPSAKTSDGPAINVFCSTVGHFRLYFPKRMVAVQRTTIEAVSAVRPLKIISLLCLLIAIACSILALCSTSWLKSGFFRTGLFQECTSSNEPTRAAPFPGAPEPGKCHGPSRNSGFLTASAVLLIIALVLTAIAAIFNVVGLSKSDVRGKYRWYRGATTISALAVLLELVALIMFPVAFYVKMNEYGPRRNWEVDWSYGIAWGATLFTLGASIMLICDKEHEEIYYKEKTIYNPPPELGDR
ncbi:unnamed protein product [Caenorhabditis auriculariae]|uniref:Uncharacterized protein n=1 Tax=Caenorhabditis auriculariae TaxID=2777116 RepID=A0A8S1HDS4_9PELO|nr:unnamed protein product [Caenorhabditis auriculariae]